MSSESPSSKSSIEYLLKETTHALQDSHSSYPRLMSSGSEPEFVTETVYVKIEPGFPLRLFSGVVKDTPLTGNRTEVLTSKSSSNCSRFFE